MIRSLCLMVCLFSLCSVYGIQSSEAEGESPLTCLELAQALVNYIGDETILPVEYNNMPPFQQYETCLNVLPATVKFYLEKSTYSVVVTEGLLLKVLYAYFSPFTKPDYVPYPIKILQDEKQIANSVLSQARVTLDSIKTVLGRVFCFAL